MLSDKVVLVKMIRATPERVFDTCTKAELLALWIGPKPFMAAHVEVDLKVGGRYLLQLRGDDGMYTAFGSYVELTPPHRIVMNWAWLETPDLPVGSAPSLSSLVTFDIQAVPDGSMLTLTHQGLPDDEAANGYRQGWAETLDKLVALLMPSDPQEAARQDARRHEVSEVEAAAHQGAGRGAVRPGRTAQPRRARPAHPDPVGPHPAGGPAGQPAPPDLRSR